MAWKCWKIQNQVLAIFLIQSLVLIMTLLMIDVFTYPYIRDLFQENSKELMIRQNNQATLYTQYLVLKNVSLILNRSLRQIVNANYLFQYSIDLDYQYIQQPLDCLDNPAGHDKYSYKSGVCYGHYGVRQQTIQDYQFFNYTALTTSLLPLYDNFVFFYAQTKADFYFTIVPGLNQTNFNAHARPWYIKYLEKNDTSLTSFCAPYLSSVNVYLSAQVTGLKYRNGTIYAVIGNTLQVLNILQTVQQNMNISIVDQTGLIYSVSQQLITQIYLYNESYTGFDYYQQMQILASLDKQPIILYNSIWKQNVCINTQSLGNTGLILIFQSNPLFQQDIINQHLIQTSKTIISFYYGIIITWICVTLFCILVSVIILLKILKPITGLTQIMRQATSPISSKQILDLYLHNSKYDSQLNNYQNAFRRMISKITQSNLHMNTQCILINKSNCYASTNQTEYLISPLTSYLSQACHLIRYDDKYNFCSNDYQVFQYKVQQQVNQIL